MSTGTTDPSPTPAPPPGGKTEGRAAATLRAVRPRQWAKNVLVFAAPVAAGSIDQRTVAVHALLAFVALVYIVSIVRMTGG